jgi:predicted metal-dependent HD superfamily phosphohydrolase
MTAAPQWLHDVWSRTIIEAGSDAEAEEICRIGDKLLERWANPARRFHGLGHLITVLSAVDELAEEALSPAMVRLAAFYHGAIIPCETSQAGLHTWGEDEAASAGLAYGQLTHLGLCKTKARRIHYLISALGSRPPKISDPDLAVLCDSERSVLASDPRTYRAYSCAIREEFTSTDERLFCQARIAVLKRWLASERLFLCPTAAPWEQPARHNVEAELTRRLSEIAQSVS